MAYRSSSTEKEINFLSKSLDSVNMASEAILFFVVGLGLDAASFFVHLPIAFYAWTGIILIRPISVFLFFEGLRCHRERKSFSLLSVPRVRSQWHWLSLLRQCLSRPSDWMCPVRLRLPHSISWQMSSVELFSSPWSSNHCSYQLSTKILLYWKAKMKLTRWRLLVLLWNCWELFLSRFA